MASIDQAEALMHAGVDTIYAGEDYFGLRLPHSFQRAELTTLIERVHAQGKQIQVAVNAIFHNDRIVHVLDYLQFLAQQKVDRITIGDPGAIRILHQSQLDLDYWYDGADLVTNSRQINFWAQQGAKGAVIANEVPYRELVDLVPNVKIPLQMLVYGATAIHQSGRPLLSNYFNFVQAHQDKLDRAKGLFIAEPHKPDTHYSIYEDMNGTHVFANNDVDLMTQLPKLAALPVSHWFLDGVFADPDNFPKIAQAFAQARDWLASQSLTAAKIADLENLVQANQPANRQLDTGFFKIDPSEVK
ncbi:peptidase, U32 family small subunit [Agrilactobacillus composti DSM 18527 = JCM 14202]|uniref:Peptidase, U32 family small subunit n=1 Tax=Agrilactobacillus composti DSM 18527 = JCM 14202 TaxID=1423734 RepID=A0A0R1XXC3_9LACO|nr:peptidase, U32 family small subunit [Agrilactobacillus composti DSM 18527 = JCM 14202]